MNRARNIWFLLGLLLMIGVGIAADHLGVFAGIDNALYDFSFRIRGQRAVSERIVIAAIDEKTLATFGRWPIPRSVYAGLLDALHDAKVVGIDVVMAEKSEDDELLARAVKNHGSAVLPVYLDKTLTVVEPALPFSASATGHVHVEPGVDNVTREVFHTLSTGGTRIPSLSSAMYRLATGAKSGSIWQRGDILAGSRTFQNDCRKINYYGPAGTFPQLSVADIITGKSTPEQLRDKIVLVGLTAPGIIDEVSTPFSQNRNRMTGVELHANILNNLLDGTTIQDVPDWLRMLAVMLFTILLWSIFPRLTGTHSLLIWMSSLALITAASSALFASANLWLHPSFLYFSVTAACSIAYLYRLDSTARRLDAEHAAISALLGGADRQPSAAAEPAAGLLGFMSEGGINLKIDRLLMAQQKYAAQLEEAVRQRTEQLEEASAAIGRMSDEMILRLAWAMESKDKDTSEHTFRIGLYARVIAERLGLDDDFIETITFASAMHDVGKIGIPDCILLKPGLLDVEEMKIIMTHCAIGERILSNSSYPKIRMCAKIALNHHERWDGSGYPNSLKGEEIPLEARIIAICDCYDSLRSKRPYKKAFDHETAFRIIAEGDGRTVPSHFDPQVLQAFKDVAPALADIYLRHAD